MKTQEKIMEDLFDNELLLIYGGTYIYKYVNGQLKKIYIETQAINACKN